MGSDSAMRSKCRGGMASVCLTYKATPVFPGLPHCFLTPGWGRGRLVSIFVPAGWAFLSWDRIHLPPSKVTVFWMGSSGVLVINICDNCITFQALTSCQCLLLGIEFIWLFSLLNEFVSFAFEISFKMREVTPNT